MVTRKDVENQTANVSNATRSGFGVSYTLPLNGARATHKLTIRVGHSRAISLSGSQVRSLMRVISTARRLAR